jgi:hypothetical protein
MRTSHALAAALLLAAAAPAGAQLSNHSIALEGGFSAPLGAGDGLGVPGAVAATSWLDGDVDLVLRLAFGTAPRTGDRSAAGWLAGTAGLRWSLAPGRVRPQLFVEAGWARAAGPPAADRLALGAGAALEVLVVPDVAVGVSVAARRAPAGAGLRADGSLSVAAYF